MPSVYLTPNDYAAYGVETATVAQVVQASAIVDQVTNRPEGFVWAPDATGAPAYMAALTPTMTFTIGAPITPGTNVVATLNPPIATPDMVGDVLILARNDTATCEAVVVSSVTGPGAVVFATVRYAHADGTTADQGLLVTEERALPANRNITRLSRLPCAGMRSLQGRYGYGRRSDQIAGNGLDFNILAAVETFGSVPAWVPLNPQDASVSPSTGEVWIPAGLLMAHFSDVRMRYVAGYAAANIPAAIKQAAANLIIAITGTADIPTQVKMYRAGDTSITRFGASNVDPETRAMLMPFKALTFF